MNCSPELLILSIRTCHCPCEADVKDVRDLQAGGRRKLANDERCHQCLAISACLPPELADIEPFMVRHGERRQRSALPKAVCSVQMRCLRRFIDGEVETPEGTGVRRAQASL